MKVKKGIIKKRLLLLQGKRTLREFAEQIGIGQSTLHNYLKGRIPKADFITLVCVRFNIDPKWLLGISEQGDEGINAVTKAAAYKMHLQAQVKETQDLLERMEG